VRRVNLPRRLFVVDPFIADINIDPPRAGVKHAIVHVDAPGNISARTGLDIDSAYRATVGDGAT